MQREKTAWTCSMDMKKGIMDMQEGSMDVDMHIDQRIRL
jgi:hypothetical protein